MHGSPSFNLSKGSHAAINNKEYLTPVQASIERVIQITFWEYGISVPITDTVRATFKTKLRRLGQRLANVNSSKRAQILGGWKESVWECQFDAIDANKALLKGMRKAE